MRTARVAAGDRGGDRRPGRRRRSGASLGALVSLLAIASPTTAGALAGGPAGTVRGSVYDAEFGVPLAGVRVSILEARLARVTSEDGHFLFERVPSGTFTVSFSRDGYERRIVTGVAVAAGRVADVRVDLPIEVIDLDEVVVTGAEVQAGSEEEALELRAAAVSLQDAISSELIGRAGAGDAAGALRLVVGASVSEGKYATVRGLSDRYTGTTLNGVRIPGSDPRRRAAQLDVFPTGTIDSVTVTKTFTPDLQGDFTGGGVDIRTKSIPDGRLRSISFTPEFNGLATGNRDFLTYRGGGTSPLADAGSDRDLPAGAGEPLPGMPRFSSRPTDAEFAAALAFDGLVRSFEPAMGVSADAPGANEGFSALAGNRYDLGGGRVLGVLGAVTHAHKYDFYDGAANNNAVVSDAAQGFAVTKPRTDSRGTDEVLVGALGNLVLQPSERDELSLKVILNQSAQDEARFQEQAIGDRTVEQNQSLHYTERTVFSAQVHGRHEFEGGVDERGARRGGARIEWLLAKNGTRQDEPDVRFFRNLFSHATLTGQMPANSTDAQNTRRIFREIEEGGVQAAVHVTLPVERGPEVRGNVRFGLFSDATDRDYGQRSFSYTFASQFGSITNAAVAANRALARFTATSPGQLWTDVFTDPGRVGLATNNPPAPNQLLWTIVPLGNDVDYDGAQEIRAAYGMTEMPLTPRLRLIGGARLETTDLSIDPINRAFGAVDVIEVQPGGDRAIVKVPQERARAGIEDRRLLPSLGAVFEIGPGMNLRASWSRTLARPTFRELAPVATEEFIFGDEYLGNPDLRLSSIANYDLRWEWIRRTGDLLAASLFHKDLTDPIELISFASGGRSFIQPVNFDRGRLRGFEVEARLGLDLFSPRLRNLGVGFNYTRIASEVEVPAMERASLADFGLDEKRRRLQGQPEYLLNWHLVWERPETGTILALFYSRTGEALLTGAARGYEDASASVFQRSFATLDLSAGHRFGRYLTLTLKVANLLTPEERSVYRRPDGEEAVKVERETARRYGLAAGFKW